MSQFISIQNIGANICIENLKIINFFSCKGFIYSLKTNEISDYYMNSIYEDSYINGTLGEILINASYCAIIRLYIYNSFSYSFLSQNSILYGFFDFRSWQANIYVSKILFENIKNEINNTYILFLFADNIEFIWGSDHQYRSKYDNY